MFYPIYVASTRDIPECNVHENEDHKTACRLVLGVDELLHGTVEFAKHHFEFLVPHIHGMMSYVFPPPSETPVQEAPA
jgi:hypothetical protein